MEPKPLLYRFHLPDASELPTNFFFKESGIKKREHSSFQKTVTSSINLD